MLPLQYIIFIIYENKQPIIHCDLKPSNVLLDDDMVAHVGDLGLARLLDTISGNSQKQTSTSEIKGTVGYVPPGTIYYCFGLKLLQALFLL